MMKPIVSLSVLCLILTTTACRGANPYLITPTRTAFVFGESPVIQEKVNFNPGSEYVEYGPAANVGISTTCTSAARDRRDTPGRDGAPSTTHPRLPLLSENLLYIGLLPVGVWRCQRKRDVTVYNSRGVGTVMTLKSNVAEFAITKPSAADERVLKETPLGPILLAQTTVPEQIKQLTGQNTIYEYEDVINKHPDSSYYCHFWIEKLRRGNSVDEQLKLLKSKGSMHEFWPDNGFVEVKPFTLENTVKLDNLLKYQCADTNPEEVYFLYTMMYLRGGYSVKVSKDAAIQGRKIAKDPRYVSWFEALLSGQP